jgi:outer membrane protein TolC
LLVEASHEEEIGRLVADLKAAREALHTARDNRRTAERDLQAVIDAEDPRIPGTEPAHRTIGVPEP